MAGRFSNSADFSAFLVLSFFRHSLVPPLAFDHFQHHPLAEYPVTSVCLRLSPLYGHRYTVLFQIVTPIRSPLYCTLQNCHPYTITVILYSTKLSPLYHHRYSVLY